MKRLISGLIFLLIMLLSSINATSFAACNAQIVSNGNTTFLIESDGTVKGWGRNDKGELGIGTTEDEHAPAVINGLSNIKEIIPAESGREYFLAVDYDGFIYSWGYNGYGQLGLGNTSNQLLPVQIPNL